MKINKSLFIVFSFLTFTFTAFATSQDTSNNENEKIVIVTGASRGIGLVTAEYLASQGYIVYGTMRDSSNTLKLDQACEKYKNHLFKVVASLTEEEEIHKAFYAIFQKHGHIDVLINNAAYVLVGTVESCTIQEQMDLFNVNYFGPVRTIQAVLPYMREKKSGTILNICSVSGISPFSPWENYSATKFALRGLTESMAASLSPWNIKVCAIEPATMRTLEKANETVGSRDLGLLDPYSFMRNYVDDSCEGHDPLDLARLLQEIIETPNPKVRYQIGEFAEYISQKIYVDPTGNEVVNSNIEYYKSVGLLPQ